MISLPISHAAPRSINSATRSGNKSAGWLRAATRDANLFIIAAFCAIGLLVTLNLIFGFPSLQPRRRDRAISWINAERRVMVGPRPRVEAPQP